MAAIKFRPIFNFIYKFKIRSPRVISQIYYEAHLFAELKKVINTDLLDLFRDKRKLPDNYGVGLSERIVELPWFLSQISESKGLHFDAGSAINYEDILFHKKLKNKKIIIGNLNPERECYWTDHISYYYGDLRKKIFIESAFDSISCISVLEHVGLNNARWTQDQRYCEAKPDDYLTIVKELKYMLRRGGECFITVPYGEHKNLKWLQVFNEMMINKIMAEFRPSTFELTFYKYSQDGWQIATEEDCKNCQYAESYPNQDLGVGAYSICCLKLIK